MKRIRVGFNLRVLWISAKITIFAEDATPRRVSEVDGALATLNLTDGQTWSAGVASATLFRTVG